MVDDSKFSLYLSHSWNPRDVELNQLVWSEISNDCELLVDAPDEAGPNPPYFINRIEELLRRSDLFLSVLPFRQFDNINSCEGSDATPLNCSIYSLFEIRLAERLNIPRLILYERKTGFRAPPYYIAGSGDEYIPFDRGSQPVPESKNWYSAIAPKIRHWIENAKLFRKLSGFETSNVALTLFSPGSSVLEEPSATTLRNVGYEQVIESKKILRSNIEAFQVLHSTGLAIVDLDCLDDSLSSQLFTSIHVLGIPTIRIMRNREGIVQKLPWLLTGHPGGYQNDIVLWNQREDVLGQIESRARAMFRISPALGNKDALAYLHSKRYSNFFVFISHTLKPPHRALVEEIFSLLKENYVTPFEYNLVNDAGDDWKKALDVQLANTTHFIALLSNGYEESEYCNYEFDEILKRGNAVKTLAFLVEGRSHSYYKIKKEHQQLLDGPDPAQNARIIVEVILRKLNEAISTI